MAENYTVEQGRSGQILVVRSAWNDALITLMRQHDIRELELNYAKGFIGKDLSFLERLTDLVVLLLTHRTIDDISAIHHLQQLRVLEVNTYCKSAIDFERFPVLEECSFEWRDRAASVFSSATLRKLFISSYSGQDADKFAHLSNLRSLGLANAGMRSLQGLGALRSLKFLGLYGLRKLESLTGIEPLTSLEHLEVNGCKNVRDIAPVAALKNLKRLHLCDDGHIQSLLPVSELRDLEEMLFYGSTHVVDGDLLPVAHLPRLKKVWFQDRLHYSRSRAELQELAGIQRSLAPS